MKRSISDSIDEGLENLSEILSYQHHQDDDTLFYNSKNKDFRSCDPSTVAVNLPVKGNCLQVEKKNCASGYKMKIFNDIDSSCSLPLIYHRDFLKHLTSTHNEIHQESPNRVKDILRALFREENGALKHIEIVDFESVPIATYDQLIAVHDADYIDFLKKLTGSFNVIDASDGAKTEEVICFSPRLVSSLFRGKVSDEYFRKEKDRHSGTRFCSETYNVSVLFH